MTAHNGIWHKSVSEGKKMTEAMKCPKCGGNVEEGEIVTQYALLRDLGTYFKNEKRKPVIAHACKKCGYIELYKEVEDS